ncbi:MAG: DUF1134 domain-containing protein [Hyphomicrobium sp.]
MLIRNLTLDFACLLAAALPLVWGAAAVAEDDLPWQSGAGRQTYDNRYDDRGYSQPAAEDRYAQDQYRQDGYGHDPYQAGADRGNGGYDTPREDAYRAGDGDRYQPRPDSFSDPDRGSPQDGRRYGEPYGQPQTGDTYAPQDPSYQDRAYQDRGYQDRGPPAGPETRLSRGYYEQGEIITAGHSFFGSISESLASAVEYAFKSQGRPNGYILGQDAGGAFVLGLRYGEGTLHTKDAGRHRVFWQGPSLGYDAGAEGSKTMVLVYNMRDPSEIYHRFAGVQGAAYLIGGVSVQFQKYGDVMLGVIRSGVGLRLGANVGYLKYTRSPTWNPL